jgi:hypothetical protein
MNYLAEPVLLRLSGPRGNPLLRMHVKFVALLKQNQMSSFHDCHPTGQRTVLPAFPVLLVVEKRKT